MALNPSNSSNLEQLALKGLMRKILTTNDFLRISSGSFSSSFFSSPSSLTSSASFSFLMFSLAFSIYNSTRYLLTSCVPTVAPFTDPDVHIAQMRLVFEALQQFDWMTFLTSVMTHRGLRGNQTLSSSP